jgi:oxygen-independent coproporphyrinogen-3 oxidase
MERIMLEARLASGLAVSTLSDQGRHAVAGLIADGLVEPAEAFRGSLVLTLKGRLLADAVVRRILPD